MCACVCVCVTTQLGGFSSHQLGLFPSLFGLQFHRLLWARAGPVDRGLRCWTWAAGACVLALVFWF